MQKTKEAASAKTSGPATSRKLRILIVVTIVVLSIQGWFGDFVNVFLAPASGTTPPPSSFAGFLQGVESLPGPFLIWHASEGIVLIVLSAAVLGLSFKWSRARSVRISAALAFIFVLLAALGGYLFVLSGFSAGGNSMQMGGSFLGAYALTFATLYYSK